MIKIKPLIKEDIKLDVQRVRQFAKKYVDAIRSKKVVNAGGAKDYMSVAKKDDKTAQLLGMFSIVDGKPRLNRDNSFTGGWSSAFESLYMEYKKTGDREIFWLLNPNDVMKAGGGK
jgi:hypothetical protein